MHIFIMWHGSASELWSEESCSFNLYMGHNLLNF